jgi:DNA-binding transcriptional LysR family regulator
MKSLTVRQLKIFEAVARHSSFSRAAEEQCLTQPAVSMQMKQLEEQAGLPLFKQAGKSITLTEAGNVMLRHSREIINQLSEVSRSIERLKAEVDRTVRIGVISSGSYFFPRLVNAFRQRRADVEFELTIGSRDDLIRRLRNDEIDLAVIVQAPEDPTMVAEVFAPNPFILVASPSHPLAGQPAIHLSEIADECLITRESGTDTRYAVDMALTGPVRQMRLKEMSCSEAIKQSVMANMGIGFLSSYATRLEMQAGLLVALDVDGFPIERSLCVTHLSRKPLPLLAQALKQFLITEGAAQIDRLVSLEAQRRDPEKTRNRPPRPRVLSTAQHVASAGFSEPPLRRERLPDQHGIQYQNHRGSCDSCPDHLLVSHENAHH